MKTRDCDNPRCGDRRVHHDMPDTPRGQRQLVLPDDYPDNKVCFCSITCACEAGYYNVRTGWQDPPKERP